MKLDDGITIKNDKVCAVKPIYVPSRKQWKQFDCIIFLFLKVKESENIPIFFIDPMVKIFLDPCNPNYMKPEKNETYLFKDEVSR